MELLYTDETSLTYTNLATDRAARIVTIPFERATKRDRRRLVCNLIDITFLWNLTTSEPTKSITIAGLAGIDNIEGYHYVSSPVSNANVVKFRKLSDLSDNSSPYTITSTAAPTSGYERLIVGPPGTYSGVVSLNFTDFVWDWVYLILTPTGYTAGTLYTMIRGYSK